MRQPCAWVPCANCLLYVTHLLLRLFSPMDTCPESCIESDIVLCLNTLFSEPLFLVITPWSLLSPTLT